MRAPNSGRTLNDADAAIVKGMIDRGDRQHDIASVFAVNGGRIGETSTGEHFAHVNATTSGLPPKAPYLVVDAKLRSRLRSLQQEVQLGGMVSAAGKATIDDVMAAFDASHNWRKGK